MIEDAATQSVSPFQPGFEPTLAQEALRAPASLTRQERLDALATRLPEHFEPYIDKYFLRSAEILEKEGLNPWVRAQVFIRKGPGEVYGIDEAVAALKKYSNIEEVGGKIYAKQDGDSYDGKETLIVIEAPVQEIIKLETFYLGVLSAETTRFNDSVQEVDLDEVRENMRQVVEAAGDRPVTYFGARHWDFRLDAAIAQAAYEGGATGASTDAGANTFGKEGVGTIPHALENIYAFYKGAENAVAESTLAFDRHIDPSVPRIALIDYNNREIDDSLATAEALGDALYAVRVDTCGENVPQGGLVSADDTEAATFRREGIALPSNDDPDAKYWYGTGVTVSGVYALRKALDGAGRSDVRIMLTSGFGDVEKVRAFRRAEETLGVKLFDALGVGGIYKPCRAATMDIVGVGETPDSFELISKVGRPYRPNPSLPLVVGKENQ